MLSPDPVIRFTLRASAHGATPPRSIDIEPNDLREALTDSGEELTLEARHGEGGASQVIAVWRKPVRGETDVPGVVYEYPKLPGCGAHASVGFALPRMASYSTREEWSSAVCAAAQRLIDSECAVGLPKSRKRR